MGKFKDTFNAEMAAQRAEKARRKEEKRKIREEKGPLILRIMAQGRNIGIGLVYSLIYMLFVYCVVMFCTLYLPDIVSVVVSFFDAGQTLAISAECGCLFLTAWLFTGSFMIIRAMTKLYLGGMRKLFPREPVTFG